MYYKKNKNLTTVRFELYNVLALMHYLAREQGASHSMRHRLYSNSLPLLRAHHVAFNCFIGGDPTNSGGMSDNDRMISRFFFRWSFIHSNFSSIVLDVNESQLGESKRHFCCCSCAKRVLAIFFFRISQLLAN